jgi:hypothetical protein
VHRDSIASHNQHHDGYHPDGYWNRETVKSKATDSQDEQDLLGGISVTREGVRGEYRQRNSFGQ